MAKKVEKNEAVSTWKEKEVKLQIRRGAKAGWWCVKIGEKKFVMREVDRFFDEKVEAKEPF